MEHVTQSDAPGGFITRDFVKPTALDRCFVNGKSFHPPHIFKSIVFGEAVRLRRINENDADYQKSLTRLQKKCDKSNFSMKMVMKVIQQAQLWTERFGPNYNNMDKSQLRLVWATSFTNIIQLEKREKNLFRRLL